MEKLNYALKQFEAAEANLVKLEALWKEITSIIPDGVAFGDPSDGMYDDHCRAFRDVYGSLPKIDGWIFPECLLELNEIGQMRLDAMEADEIGCKIVVEERIYEQGKHLKEYRYRLSKKRRQLIQEKCGEDTHNIKGDYVGQDKIGRDKAGGDINTTISKPNSSSTPSSTTEKTKHERIIEWCKNRWLICIVLIVFTAVIGFGAFTVAIDKINEFWLKPNSSSEQEINVGNVNNLTDKPADRKTQLRPRIKKRVDELYDEIDNEKLKPWVFINAGIPVRVTKHDGSVISCEGVRFEGAPRLVFWSDDFIPPIIENAIVKAFDQTIEECRTNGKDPEPHVYETNLILADFIYRVYNRMASIDSKLTSKGPVKNIQLKDVTDEISKMKRCLKRQYDAAVLLASKN